MTDNIQLTAESFKIHTAETVSTGDYESFEARATLEGSVDAVGPLTECQRKALKARLLAVEKDLQEAVERSCANRLRADGHEDWSVPEREDSDG